jgi:NAD(P)-dependent dehydrogenase (short-subunit alcohol dehydrogenase family)
VLVNGAGINRRKPILEVTVDDFDAITAVNMRAVYLLSQAAHPHLKQSGRGSIVNLSVAQRPLQLQHDFGVRRHEGSGFGNDAQFRPRMGERRHPRQLHRTRRGADRVHQAAVG